MMKKPVIFLLFLIIVFSCSDQVFQDIEQNSNFNGPIGMGVLKFGAFPYLLVVNSNFDLSQTSGTLSLIDLNKFTFVSGDPLKIESLGGQLKIDESEKKLFISDKENFAILEYSYETNKDGRLISLRKTATLKVDSNPYDFIRLKLGKNHDKFYVTNTLTGLLSIIERKEGKISTKEIMLDSTDYNPFRISAGIGITTLIMTRDKKFLLVSGTNSNVIFIVDLLEENMEGYITFDPEFGSTDSGVRGMILLNNKDFVYFTSSSQHRILKIDLSKIADNKINEELVNEALVGSFPITGKDPSSMDVSPDDRFLYVLNFDSANISVFDTVLETQIKEIEVEKGPTNIYIYKEKKLGFVTNFLSDSVSIIELENNKRIKTISNPKNSKK